MASEKKSKLKLSTSRLLSRIRAAKSSHDVVDLVERAGEPDFSTLLYNLMEVHDLKARDMIERTQIERSYFYHILSGKKSNPSRNMVLRIGIAAEGTVEEINRLLRLAGVAMLYPRIGRDALLIYGIQQKMKMGEVNDLLLEHGHVPLFREEKHE